MLKYKNRYKDRSPKNTIKIIKNFFLKRGYTIEEQNNKKSEADTWFCHLILRKNGKTILRSNGKGTKEIYSLASGYAEMYERFCNRCPMDEKLLLNYYYRNYIKKTKGYYYCPEERTISIEEIINNPVIYNSFYNYTNGDENFFKELILYLTNNNLIGVPYKALDSNNIVYNSPVLLTRVIGSQGMAAGNTLEEALVQANSEVYEKYVGQSFFDNKFDRYFAIDFSTIKNKFLLEKINKIKTLGYKFYVIDLSYNYGMPVLMSILLEPKRGQLYTNFGAFPNFDIALERIITELYQGIENHKNNYSNFLVPYKHNATSELLATYSNTNIENCFPEDFFNKLQYIEFNKNVFSNGKTSQELLNYFKKLNKKLGYDFYYYNASLDKNMYAIQLYCPTLKLNYILDRMISERKQKIDFSIVKEIFSAHYAVQKELINNQCNFQTYRTLFDYINNYQKEFHYFSFYLNEDPIDLFTNYISLMPVFTNFFNICPRELLLQDLRDTSYFNQALKYLLLYPYKQSNQYSKKEVLHIFNGILDFNLTEEEYDLCQDGEFFIKEVFFKTFCRDVEELLKNLLLEI